MANPNSEVWAAPYSEVKEEVSHYLPVLLTVVAKQLNQVLNNCKSLYCDECRRDLRGRGEVGRGEVGRGEREGGERAQGNGEPYILRIPLDRRWSTFCSRAPMIAGPSARKKTCWLVAEPLSMDMRRRKNAATPSPSVCERGRLRLYVANSY